MNPVNKHKKINKEITIDLPIELLWDSLNNANLFARLFEGISIPEDSTTHQVDVSQTVRGRRVDSTIE